MMATRSFNRELSLPRRPRRPPARGGVIPLGDMEQAMSNIENVVKSLRVCLDVTHKQKHSTFALVNALIPVLRDSSPEAWKAAQSRFVAIVAESKIAKEENWDEPKCAGYLRQFVYDARQAINHGLVQRDGTLADGKAEITTHRQLRKVTEEKRKAKSGNSAGRTAAAEPAKNIGEAIYNRAVEALKPFLPQLVEHGQLQNIAQWLQEQTGFNWTVYKK